ncbi:MAG: hypothetical protein R6V84_06030 [Desulfobacterales bacterium]
MRCGSGGMGTAAAFFRIFGPGVLFMVGIRVKVDGGKVRIGRCTAGTSSPPAGPIAIRVSWDP